MIRATIMPAPDGAAVYARAVADGAQMPARVHRDFTPIVSVWSRS